MVHQRSKRSILVLVLISSLLVLLYWHRLHRQQSGRVFVRTDGGLVYFQAKAKSKLLSLVSDHLLDLQGAFPAVWVQDIGNLLTRLAGMNSLLEAIRQRVIQKYRNTPWQDINQTLLVIDGKNDTYLKQVANSGDVIPILLPWIPQAAGTTEKPLYTMNDTTNLLVQAYYNWIAEPTLCHWIKSNITNMRYHIVFGGKCIDDRQMAFKPSSLDVVFLHARRTLWNQFPYYPSYFYTDLPKHVTYILLATDALFTGNGDLITKGKKYVPKTCGNDMAEKPPNGYIKAPLFDEVFSISQFWGSGFFHKNCEEFPRIAPFLPFLTKNLNIKIHVFENGKYTEKILNYLGISSDRLVTGLIRAKFAYMPETTFCGHAHVINSQILSKIYYQDIIHKKLRKGKERNSIILIRRSGHRKLTSHNEVEDMLRNISGHNNLQFEMFIDNPVPSLEETMKMFNRAVMVVAPHGAGLSNLMFVEPETFVIEGVCNRPHVNFCYQRLAHILGHHYHAIPSQKGCEGVITIDARDVENVVRSYLPYALKLKK